MSVERLVYRQILKRVARVSSRCRGPSDVCFTVLGIMLRLEDFAAAGYGDTPRRIVRSVFARSSIAGLAGDTPVARLSSAFDVLRRLNDAIASNDKVRDHVHGQNYSSSYSNNNNNNNDASDGGVSKGKKFSSSSGASMEVKGAARCKDETGAESTASSTAAAGDGDDDVITIANGTVFIEGSVSRKVRKISRHVVFCMVLDRLPSYRFLIPPEPLYTRNMRTSFKFPLIVDALLIMAASANIQVSGQAPVVIQNDVKTAEEYNAMCDSIPTTTVTITDYVEVELRTEYVCSRIPEEDKSSDGSDDRGDTLDPYSRGSGGSSGTRGITSSSGASSDSSGGSNGHNSMSTKEYVFRYLVFIRNYGPSRNTKKWHVQLLSRHWVIFDECMGQVTEVIGPGVAGNFPLLAPGESHTYESGVSLSGTSGVMRGTFQMNAYNEDGESRCIDVHIGPTRLNARVATKPL